MIDMRDHDFADHLSISQLHEYMQQRQRIRPAADADEEFGVRKDAQ